MSSKIDTKGPLPDSVRSVGTSNSVQSEGSTSQRMSSLQSNLMRTQSHRNPMDIYEVMEILGEGSMGSVSRVRKRADAVGGSARAAFVQKHSARASLCAVDKCCFGLFAWMKFLPSQKDAFVESSRSNYTTSNYGSTTTAVSQLPAPSSTGGSSDDGGGSTNTSDHSNKHRHMYRKQSSLVKYEKQKKDNFYALKSIHLDRCSSKEYIDELKNEVSILKNLDHPNIVRAIETYNYHNRLYLVLSLCSGGDLYTREPYTEASAQTIVKSLFSAVAYLHSRGIVHRDLKFENIMFGSPNSDVVKIIDFGLSQKFAQEEVLHDQVGTVYTMAPELLAGDYNEKADVWSLGVITFMLLSSSMPFYGRDRVHVIKRIIQGKFHFKARRWASVSKEAKSFIVDCLTNDPKLRPSADEAQHALWVRHRSKTARSIKEGGSEDQYEIFDKIQATMATFATYSKLKQLALMVVAYKSTPEEIGYLRDIFQQFDSLGNGEITLPEFKSLYMENYDFTDEELETLFHGIDLDGTGVVHYIEFLASTIESRGAIDEDRLAEAFDRLDCDDSGWITVENLKEFLGEDVPVSYLEQVIDEADIEKDHRISYDEFIALWNEDDDELYKENYKVSYSRHSSKVSNSSFDDDNAVSERSSGEDTTDMSSADGLGGTGAFNERKHMSVRAGWV